MMSQAHPQVFYIHWQPSHYFSLILSIRHYFYKELLLILNFILLALIYLYFFKFMVYFLTIKVFFSLQTYEFLYKLNYFEERVQLFFRLLNELSLNHHIYTSPLLC